MLLAVWQASSSLGWVDANILASPLEVLRALHQGLLDGSLPTAMGASLERTVAGLALGGGAGLALGLLLGLSARAERFAGPSLSALRQVAIFAWVPLLTAWFGLGRRPSWPSSPWRPSSPCSSPPSAASWRSRRSSARQRR